MEMKPTSYREQKLLQTVTRKELIDRICARLQGVKKKEVQSFLNALEQELHDLLTARRRIPLKIGVFDTKFVAERRVLDPSGRPVQVPAHYKVRFRPSRSLKQIPADTYEEDISY